MTAHDALRWIVLRLVLLAPGILPGGRLGAVEITKATFEERPQLVVRTERATYFYDRAGGGFSRLVDPDGRDWIAFRKEPLAAFPASAAAGYRGLPNLVFGANRPDAGAGHPGFDRCESEIVDANTIRTTSLSGRWRWSWTFTEADATFTMERASAQDAWWFLYEGPIAGSYDPTRKLWGTDAGGPSRETPSSGSQRFDHRRWIYFGDESVARLLLLVQHEQDELDDTLWYLGASDRGALESSDGMVVFGFGRGPGATPLLRGAGLRFSISMSELPAAAGELPVDQVQAIAASEAGRLLERFAATDPWPGSVRDVLIESTADASLQHALFWRAADSETPRPLLVALHSWSGDYRQAAGLEYLTRSQSRSWHFIHPDFRGVNETPDACCSDRAVRDVLDAVKWASSHANVDPRRVYLVGASGGGMAALQLLAKAPKVWTAVSSWVPISDLAAWHRETASRGLRYSKMIEACVGGVPGLDAAVDFASWNRSPLHFLANGRGVPLDLNAGIRDGHEGSVPISHSLRAFNALARTEDRLEDAWIERMTRDAEVPAALRHEGSDPSYGARSVLFRRSSGAARLTLFDGGHEIVHDAAFDWLERQSRAD